MNREERVQRSTCANPTLYIHPSPLLPRLMGIRPLDLKETASLANITTQSMRRNTRFSKSRDGETSGRTTPSSNKATHARNATRHARPPARHQIESQRRHKH